MKIGHAANRGRRRSSFIDDPDAKLFPLPIQMQKKGRTRSRWPLESAAAEEIENRGLRHFFLMISSNGLESTKRFPHLPPARRRPFTRKPYKQGNEIVLACIQL
jgi:hypothetical protein